MSLSRNSVHTLGEYYQLLLKNGLLADTQPLKADFARTVPLVSCDSRVVVPGALFICKGAAFREEYLLTAVKLGAAAYVSERPYPGVSAPCIAVTDIRAAMALLADLFWNHPSGKVDVIGITGTKGKTTTAFFLKAILDRWQESRGLGPTALLSSLMVDDGVERREATLTTPEPLDLQRHLAHAAQSGFVTMEVSSQALKYHRTLGVEFAVGVFLNIGEDHISPVEHPDFEDYFSSKLRLFSQCAAAVVNLDCDHAHRVLAAARAAGNRVVTFSLRDPSAQVYADGLTLEEGEARFTLHTPRFTTEVSLPMSGWFNVENALAAAAAAEILGVDGDAVTQGLAQVRVPGRMETYHSARLPLTVVVDYAHNGMSLEALLSSLRQDYPDRELTVVFGCPGGKALDRRESMAAAAARWAHHILLTEDDPAGEEVADICAQIGGYIATLGGTYTVIPDREEAVRTAVLEAHVPAVVVLAGKGAEHFQKRKGGSEPCVPDALLSQRALAEIDSREEA